MLSREVVSLVLSLCYHLSVGELFCHPVAVYWVTQFFYSS